MKAYLARGYGGPEVMSVGELPNPVAGKGEVVVAVHASSVNPVDWKVRNGLLRFLTGRRFPKVYGSDFAGKVESVGPGVTGLSVGDPVYGFTPVLFRKPGAHAEEVAVAAAALRPLPAGLGFEQAAAIPVAALTAHNGFSTCGELSGKRVLVNGATGGVGHFAVQLARVRGAQVTAVCGAAHAEEAKRLGAERVIDYRSEDFTKGTERYDVIFDAFGQRGFVASRAVLTPRGVYVTTHGTPAIFLRALCQKLVGGQRIAFANMRDKPEDYEAIETLLATGRIAPLVARVFTLDEAGAAYAASEGGGVAGKIVIRVR